MKQINRLHSDGIMVFDKHYDVDFYFCSDWKFLSLMIGIKAANSTFFCPWCLCAKEYRDGGTTVDWSKYPRDWHNPKANKCYDCHQRSCTKPLHDLDPSLSCLLSLPFSPSKCLLDPLHCLLRTSDILENILYERVDQKGLNSTLEKFFIENKIAARIKKIDKESHTVEWTTLNAEQRVTMWRTMDIAAIFRIYFDLVLLRNNNYFF